MSVAGQAVNRASVLSQFLNEVLPERQLIAEEWGKQAAEAPWSGVAVDGDRRGLGLATEMRIGLDLAQAPGYRDLLSFLPPGEYGTLLRGAGHIPAEYEHLADTGTEDPLLLEWVRSWQPIALDDGQRAVLATCCDVAQMHDLTDPSSGYSVQLRRSFFVHLRTDLAGDGHAPIAPDATVRALGHLWEGYLRHGRRQLAGLGQRVVLALKLAGGFGIADLIAGRSLVEIKTVLDPAGRFGQWLNQLLGYVLLDWFDIFRLDTVAVYLGWQAKLMAMSLTDLLTIASRGQTPLLEDLRADFRQAIQAEVQLRKQYPPPLAPAASYAHLNPPPILLISGARPLLKSKQDLCHQRQMRAFLSCRFIGFWPLVLTVVQLACFPGGDDPALAQRFKPFLPAQQARGLG
jgi:hypothetical protein